MRSAVLLFCSTLLAFMIATPVFAQDYSTTFRDIRRYQANISLSMGVDPHDAISTVISGSAAIDMLELVKGTSIWSSSAGSAIYAHLTLPNAKAILVDNPGTKSYLLIPAASWEGGDSPVAAFNLSGFTCDDVVPRIGRETTGASWCTCLIGCPPDECETCPNDDFGTWKDKYPNDKVLFSTIPVTTVLPLWVN